MHRRLNGLTIMGMTMVFVFGSWVITDIAVLLTGSENRWTPRRLALSFEDGRERVRVLVADEPLGKLIDEGRLYLATDEATPRRLIASDLRFRFNNWDRVRAGVMWRLAVALAVFVAGAVLLVFGLVLPGVFRKVADEARRQQTGPAPG